MNDQDRAEKIVAQMMADDAFSQWLGIEVVKVTPGFAHLRMKVRPEMVNGFKVSHGGIAFSLADSALAFASNSYGRVALALDNQISFTQKVMPGDLLEATADEVSRGNRIGVYGISIHNQDGNLIASVKGTVFITKERHLQQ